MFKEGSALALIAFLVLFSIGSSVVLGAQVHMLIQYILCEVERMRIIMGANTVSDPPPPPSLFLIVAGRSFLKHAPISINDMP